MSRTRTEQDLSPIFPVEGMLSIVIPVYNDEEVLEELHRRLIPVAEAVCHRYEVVFIDDASVDGSWEALTRLHQANPNLRLLKLGRNFGQDGAITAGLQAARGDFIAIMDSDLQDPPEDIFKLFEAMLAQDALMAIARWRTRKDSLFRRAGSRFLHALTNWITNIRHPIGLGVFRVMRRQVLEALEQMPERTSTTLSQLYWLGSEYAVVELDRDERHAGTSSYTLRKMVKLSFDRIFSYSIFPIQLSIVLGMLLTLASFATAGYFVAQKLWFGDILPGWTSLIVATLFLFGMNFLFLGILGEYLGRVFLETKARPRYVVSRVVESPPPENAPAREREMKPGATEAPSSGAGTKEGP
jgi:dolichol-phosphate mannosyltransferase